MAAEVLGITELAEVPVQQPRRASPTTTIGIGQRMGPQEKDERLDELLRQATELGFVNDQMISTMKRNIREVRPFWGTVRLSCCFVLRVVCCWCWAPFSSDWPFSC